MDGNGHSQKQKIPLMRGFYTSNSGQNRDDRLSRWCTDLARRSDPNVALVALANKTVRMAWAMMQNESDYDPECSLI